MDSRFGPIMVDLDNFKSINDSCGHSAGDAVLKKFGEILKDNVRRCDMCARIGGEEFVIILTHVDKEGVLRAVEHIRRLFESYTFTFGSRNIRVTASFGIACLPSAFRLVSTNFSRAPTLPCMRRKIVAATALRSLPQKKQPLPIAEFVIPFRPSLVKYSPHCRNFASDLEGSSTSWTIRMLPPSPEPFVHAHPAVSCLQPSLTLFAGPDGIRAGWRLLIFFAILSGLASVEALFARFVLHHPARAVAADPTKHAKRRGGRVCVGTRRVVADGQNRKQKSGGLWFAMGARVWLSLLAGFANWFRRRSRLLLVGYLGFGRSCISGPSMLHGIELWKYAVLWGLAFLAVAFFEEFFFRGYMLFTLTTALGFWPSAILCSMAFGYVHHSNPHETWLGAITAGLVGLVFCLLLRRTGNLWMPIGFHASWDWGETYFYGVPDSGQLPPGHLLSANFNGPAWLTGGTVGPEGSWLCILLLVCLWFIFAAWLRESRYPLNPRHVQTCERRECLKTLP